MKKLDVTSVKSLIERLEAVLQEQAAWGSETAYWLLYETEPPESEYEVAKPQWLRYKPRERNKADAYREARAKATRLALHSDVPFEESLKHIRALSEERAKVRSQLLESLSPLLEDTSHRKGRGSSIPNRLKKEVQDRDGGICQVCGSGPYHRLRPTYHYGPENWIHESEHSQWISVANVRTTGGDTFRDREAAIELVEKYESDPPSAPFVTKISLECDHVIPRDVGSPHAKWNLWLLCSRCNTRKSDHLHPRGIRLAMSRVRVDA